MARKETAPCPACGAQVQIVTRGKAQVLASHDRKPDDGPPERCTWSGEPMGLVRGARRR